MTATRTTWTPTSDMSARIKVRTALSSRPAERPMPSEALMMTVKDVADACHFSETAVRRAVHDGERQAVKLRSRLRITRQAFDAWSWPNASPPPPCPTRCAPPDTRRLRSAQPPVAASRALVDTNSVRTQAQ